MPSSSSSSNLVRASGIAIFITFMMVTLVAYFNQSTDHTSEIGPEPEKASTSVIKRELSSATPTNAPIILSEADSLGKLAEKVLRTTFNRQRQSNCTSLPQYNQPGVVQYAKTTVDEHGQGRYIAEIAFGNDAVLAQFAFLPSSNIKSTLQLELLVSTPESCDSAVSDHLAVSEHGERKF
jgi:hypothetical protein